MNSSYLISNRSYTLSLSLHNEFNFSSDKNYLFDISYFSALSVSGENTGSFLQGQLSCDIRKVNNQAMRQGAMCNLKGRVLSLLDVIEWQGLKLILPSDLLAETKNSLMKTAILSRVELEEEKSIAFYGFYLNNDKDILPFLINLPSQRFDLTATAESCCYSLGNQLYIIAIKKEAAESLVEPFKAVKQWRGSLAWHFLRMHTKHIEIYPKTRGLFLPHRLDLHLSDYLNFDKGCYKGQEIVARTHYKAKLKHNLQIFKIITQEPLVLGARLLNPVDNSEVGELIDLCPLENQSYLIAASVIFDYPGEVKIENQSHLIRLL